MRRVSVKEARLVHTQQDYVQSVDPLYFFVKSL